MRHVAEAAGVGLATASKALRGLAGVNTETGRRIRAVADGLGYVRDPQLASALAFARRPDKPVYRETLAFLADWPAKHFAEMPWLEEMRAGTSRRAEELGYGMEVVECRASPREQRAQCRQLRARGIRGLIVTPGLRRVPYTLDFDWARFAPVEIGSTLHPPLLSQIIRDSPYDYAAMLENLHRRGYRRIGLAVTEREEQRHHWALLSAYLTFHYTRRGIAPLRPLARETRPAVIRWARRERPDAVVTNGHLVGEWLRDAGWRIPEDLGLCRIDAVEEGASGLRPDYAGMGRAAVEMLAARLEHGELGPPANPSLLCIRNHWREGATLRGMKKGGA